MTRSSVDIAYLRWVATYFQGQTRRCLILAGLNILLVIFAAWRAPNSTSWQLVFLLLAISTLVISWTAFRCWLVACVAHEALAEYQRLYGDAE